MEEGVLALRRRMLGDCPRWPGDFLRGVCPGHAGLVLHPLHG